MFRAGWFERATRLTSAVVRGWGGYNPGAQVPGGVHFDLEMKIWALRLTSDQIYRNVFIC